MPGGTWLCVTEGFPGLPFFVNEDLTRSDGVVQCHQVTPTEAVRYGWRVLKALRILLDFVP